MKPYRTNSSLVPSPLKRKSSFRPAEMPPREHRMTRKIAKALRKITPKRRKRMRDDARIRTELIGERGARCQLHIDGVCTGRVEGIHHLKKQSQGGTNAKSNLLLSCNRCNGWVEDHPAEAHDRGLVIRHGETVKTARRKANRFAVQSRMPAFDPTSN